MADHIATRKSTFTSASASRKRRTHQPSVRDFGRRVDVYSKPEKYGLMAKQKQAEECVLYVRVSTTRQAEDGVSIDAQIAKGKANAEFRNLLLPDENIFIDDGVSAKVPLWSRPAAKQMKEFILKQKIKHIFAYRMDRLFRSTIDCLATVEELDEFGVGIHGEPGRKREKIQPSKTIVGNILDAILDNLKPQKNEKTLLFVNGMGGTPLTELYLVYDDACQILQSKGVEVTRSLVGNYCTSLEMQGASITILKCDEEILKNWDAPVHTAAMRWGM